MFTAKHRDELEDKGYTVIENAVPDHAHLKKQIYDWMKDNFPKGSAPYSTHSIVRHYGIGHLEPVWATRLAVKKYFSQLWGTEHLLSSIDAVAIGEPPEKGVEEFDSEQLHWLHVDQCAARVGLHAYQGAVYLETADEDDWTFEVLEGSHQHLEALYKNNDKAKIRSVNTSIWRMREDDLQFYKDRGCPRKRVPVKAGGLLLWDSRLVHANARPVRGRAHSDRWRLVVLVCMGPAAWTTKEDIQKKREAYNNLLMTTHWPCDDVGLMTQKLPSYSIKSRTNGLSALPEVAKTLEARQLAGVTPYKVTPESKVVAWRPKWDSFLRHDMAERTVKMYRGDGAGFFVKVLVWMIIVSVFAVCLRLVI